MPKASLLPSKKLSFICFSEKPFKNNKKCILFHLKNSFVIKMFNFCSDFSGHVGKRLDKKTKVNFKIYDLVNWERNNYITQFAQYLMK